MPPEHSPLVPPSEPSYGTVYTGRLTVAVTATKYSAGKFKFTTAAVAGNPTLSVTGPEYDCYNIYGVALAINTDVWVWFHPQAGLWYIIQADC